MSLASANYKPKSILTVKDSQRPDAYYLAVEADAWGNKIAQASVKAKTLFKDDPEVQELVTSAEEKVKTLKKKLLIKYIFFPGFAIWLWPLLIIIGSIGSCGQGGKIEKEATRLRELDTQIVQFIDEGDYNKAEQLLMDLEWTYAPSLDKSKKNVAKWQERQKQLEEKLEAAKNGGEQD